jgi:hypothetical protein
MRLFNLQIDTWKSVHFWIQTLWLIFLVIIHFKTKINTKYEIVKVYYVPHRDHGVLLSRDRSVKAVTKTIAVCCKNQTGHKNVFCGQNAESLLLILAVHIVAAGL